MQFNKCSRCGCFFVNSGDVCPNCAPKDNFEMNKLKNFLEDSEMNCSMETISYDTGISMKNLNRYFSKDSFVDYKPSIKFLSIFSSLWRSFLYYYEKWTNGLVPFVRFSTLLHIFLLIFVLLLFPFFHH